MRALENLPLTNEVADALITQVKRHAFTTGHTAARIMGRKGIKKGVRILRGSLSSDDYLLQAEAALALARLDDRQSIPEIEEVLKNSRIPLVRIYAAAALEILKSTASLPYLFETLRQGEAPPYFRDEIILSIAGILGIGDWFYEYYSQFLNHARTGTGAIIDYLKDGNLDPERLLVLTDIVRALQPRRDQFRERVASELRTKHAKSSELITTLASAAENESLMRFDRLAFLMAAILARLECGDTIGP